jgi:hypothetical protein
MMVYILVKRYIDQEKGLERKTIKQVYADAGRAYERLEEKQANGDFGWFVVKKQVIGAA